MPALLINMANDRWFAAVANTNIRYNFLGATPELQIPRVQEFALSMREAAQAAAQAAAPGEVPNVAGQMAQLMNNSIDLNGTPPAQVVTDLFSTTDSIVLQDVEIYPEVAQEVLLDVMNEAGEVLAVAMGAV